MERAAVHDRVEINSAYFCLLMLPTGVYTGFIATAMPFLLRREGVAVDRIASISSVVLMPMVWVVFFAPLIDIGFRRKTWLVICALASALCLAAAVLCPLPSQVAAFAVLMTIGCTINQLISSANGGLMASTLEPAYLGSGAGWSQAGTVGGGVLGGGVALWVITRYSLPMAAIALAGMVALPSLTVMRIPERREPQAPKHLWDGIRVELLNMLKSRRTLVGFVYFLSPVSCAAAATLLSGMAVDYKASVAIVIYISGFMGSLLSVAGSLAGGYVADRMDRRLVYVLAGLLCAGTAAVMAASPLAPLTFALGSTAYLISAGACYASFSALALELVHSGGELAATQFTIYGACANVPLVYMIWLDGRGYAMFGARGLLGIDAAAGVLAAVGLLYFASRTSVPAARLVEVQK